MIFRASLVLSFSFLLLAACDSDRSREANSNKGRTGTGRETGGLREFGEGDHAVLLSGTDEPPKYCWYIKETTIVTADGMRHAVENLCVDGGVDCVLNQPMGSTIDEPGSYYESITFETVGWGALYGTCETLD